MASDFVIDEIIDRFGNMPQELENLIEIARIKYLAKDKNISKIQSKKTAVVFTFEQTINKKDENIDFNENLNALLKKYGNKIKFSAGVKPMITLEIGTTNERQILNDVTCLIGDVSFWDILSHLGRFFLRHNYVNKWTHKLIK